MKSMTLLLVFVALTLQVTGQTSPRFEDYEVAIHKGTIHRPIWIRRVADDEWRDELGKLVEPPETQSPFTACFAMLRTAI